MKLFSVFLMTILVCGCAFMPDQRLGEFTAASSFTIRNMNFDTNNSVKTTGEDCVVYGGQGNDARIQRAMDNAIRAGQQAAPHADLLVNVRIDHTFPMRPDPNSLPGMLGIPTRFDCIEVSGDLVSLK